MKRRITGILLVLTMILTMLPAFSVPASAAQYTQPEIEEKLEKLIEKYEGTTWNDSYQGAIQCKGFADMIFDELFGTGGPGPYHASAYYYLPSPHACYALGVMAPGYSASKEEDVERIQQLLSQAAPGDYIQMHRTGKDYGHTMIVISVDATGLTVMDCNFVGTNLVGVSHRSWYFMALYTDGISLYRHDGYTPGNYTITYHANGGADSPEPETYPVGVAATISQTQPVYSGYTFLGWSEDVSAQTAEYLPGGSCSIQENTTLFAVWTADRCDFADGALVGQDSGDGIWGDLNGDGTVDEQDVAAFNAVRNGDRQQSDYRWALADVDGSGEVDLDDGILLHAYASGTLEMLGHRVELTEQIPATMTTAGEDTYTCSRCGAEWHVTTKTLLEQTMEGFTDVDSSRWYYDSILFVIREELMVGLDGQHFGTNTPVTRGMLVTILYRHSGDDADYENPFADVPEGRYFSKAAAWAANCGVVTGITSTSFAPNQNITREQTATILFRYAALLGLDTTQASDLSGYTDVNSISRYAYPAVAWANAAGIMTGRTATTLDPGGTATRAEVARMLMRLLADE